VPLLIEKLRNNFGKPLHPKVRETLLRFGKESVPVYLETLKAANEKDYRDLDFRLAMLELVYQLDDKRAIPYLWDLSASKKYPEAVRKRGREVLASLLRVDVADVPPSREKLTQMAESHYRRQSGLPKDKDVKIWTWNGEAITGPFELSPARAEEEFGMRYAREALELDPSYQPAQMVYLNMTLEQAFRGKVDKFLTEAQPLQPKMQQFLTTLDADLAVRIMEQAMEDRQPAIILPLIHALGERGEFRAARNTSGGARGIVRGLYYPDRRVQFAAMQAMLKMPPSTTPAVAADRIVELSRRFLASDIKSKALVAYAPATQKAEVRKAVSALGFDPVPEDKVADVLRAGRDSADFDLVILHHGMADSEFPFIYAKLRGDHDLAGLPMLVVVTKMREKTVKAFVARDRGVSVITADLFKSDDDLKSHIEGMVKGSKLTPGERQKFSVEAIDKLWRMARGELTGYDVTPALDVIKSRATAMEYAPLPIEILGRMPGKAIQLQLAGLVGDAGLDEKRIRIPAAMELNRHMQKNGVLLDKNQLANLKKLANQAAEGSEMRAQLNVTVSLFSRGAAAAKTGADILKFQADPPPMPKEKDKEKEKEKEKDKDKDK
jgi:hypothetical protein